MTARADAAPTTAGEDSFGRQRYDDGRTPRQKADVAEQRAGIGRRHAHTAEQLENLYCAEHVHGIRTSSGDLSFRMAAAKSVAVAEQGLRAALRSELGGENRSGGGARPVNIKGLDDDEEHQHLWGSQTHPR